MNTSIGNVGSLNKNHDIYDYTWGLRMNRFLLQLFGLWPKFEETRMDRIKSNTHFILISSFIAITVVAPQTAAMTIIWGHLTIFMDCGLANFVFSLAIVKLTFMLYKKEGLRKIFKMIAEDWLENLHDEERLILIQSSKMSKKLCILGLVLTLTSVTTYHAPVLLELGFLMRTPTNLTDVPGRKTTFISIYPFDYRPWRLYKAVVYTQYLGAASAVVGFTVTDLLFANIVFHAASLMKNLSIKIRYMFDDDFDDYRENLRIIVERYCRIIDLVDSIGDVFNILLLGIFMSFAVTFCIHGFCMINYASEEREPLKDIFSIVFSISHFSDLVFNVFLASWAGQELTDQSELVFDEMYNVDWFNLKPKESVLMVLLLLRFKHSLVVNAGYFIPMNFNTFTRLMKTCGGYISVLVAMKD